MVYYMTVVASRIFFRLIFNRVVIHNVEVFKKLRKESGFILAPNHISNIDPVFIGGFAPPKIYFLAKKELFANFFSNWMMRQLNSLPINREMPEKSILKQAIDLLKNKQCVLIFPEGTRSKDGNLQEAKLGISMIAFKAKVPVLPCFISGSNQRTGFFSRPQLTFTYGDPLYLEEFYAKPKLSKAEYKLMGDAIMRGIKATADKAAGN